MTVYEIFGWPNTCPSERFSCGLFKTQELADKAMLDCLEDYSNCSFEIEIKTIFIGE